MAVVPSPHISSTATQVRYIKAIVGWDIGRSESNAAPSFVIEISPAPPKINFNVPAGPKLVFIKSAIASAAEIFIYKAIPRFTCSACGFKLCIDEICN